MIFDEGPPDEDGRAVELNSDEAALVAALEYERVVALAFCDEVPHLPRLKDSFMNRGSIAEPKSLSLDPRVFAQLLIPKPVWLAGLGPHGLLQGVLEPQRAFIGGRVFATMSQGPIAPSDFAAEILRVWHAIRSDVIPGAPHLPGRRAMTIELALQAAGHHDGARQIGYVVRTFAAAGDLRKALLEQRRQLDAMLEQLEHFAALER